MQNCSEKYFWIFKEIKLSKLKLVVYVEETEIELTKLEYLLMEFFIKNSGRVFYREQIIKSVWGDNYIGEDRVIDSCLKRLKKKEEKLKEYFKSVRGIGYIFE